MRDADTSEFYGNLGYRKTTPDKLTWKNEIQKRLDICIATYETNMFGKNVERLVKTIYFNIRGYKFKKLIDEEDERLKTNVVNKIIYHQTYEPYRWGCPIRQIKMKYNISEKYYKELYEFITQLIAEKGLLLDTDVYIPIQVKKPMSVKDYGDISG